jgi:phage terminase small subunit
MTKLTPKQRRFCEEYPKDLNATQAAIRAGYSTKTARVIGCENLTKPYIQEKIQKTFEQITEENEITMDRIIQEICSIAFSDPLALFDGNGRLKDMGDLPKNVAQAISSFDVTQISRPDGGIEKTKKVRMCDKLKALEMLVRLKRQLEGEKPQEGTQPQEDIAQIEERIRNMSDAELERTIDERLRMFRQMNKERK